MIFSLSFSHSSCNYCLHNTLVAVDQCGTRTTMLRHILPPCLILFRFTIVFRSAIDALEALVGAQCTFQPYQLAIEATLGISLLVRRQASMVELPPAITAPVDLALLVPLPRSLVLTGLVITPPSQPQEAWRQSSTSARTDHQSLYIVLSGSNEYVAVQRRVASKCPELVALDS